MTTILIAEDNRSVADAAARLLESESWHTQICRDAVQVCAAARGADCVLLDLNFRRDTTSGEEGLAILGDLQRADPDLPVIVMTAWGTVELAVDAIKRGARDFIEKPWDNQRLISIVRTQLDLAASRQDRSRLAEENRLLKGEEPLELIAESPPMREVLHMARRVAPTDAAVLITGPNGSGKTLLARYLHAHSGRPETPLINVNMGAIPESLFESEMFGHARGAFTDAKEARIGRFELAADGSLFMDEIANIPPTQQPKLLRVLEDRQFERVGESRSRRFYGRLISATNGNLDALIEEGLFRRDLLYRLNTVALDIPPLNARIEDIEPLARHLLDRFGTHYGRDLKLTSDAVRALKEYGWPGNVRELSHVLERAVILCDANELGRDELQLRPQQEFALPIQTLDELERQALTGALARHEGNVDRAAAELGLSRSACYRRIEKHGL